MRNDKILAQAELESVEAHRPPQVSYAGMPDSMPEAGQQPAHDVWWHYFMKQFIPCDQTA